MIDRHFRIETLAQTPNPQRLIWASAHQCVCEGAAIDDPWPAENKAGEYAIKHLLKGHRGHYSPLEAPQISFNAIGFPHAVMQQATRHRVAVHFSVQSGRYTGERVILLAEGAADVEEVFYFRPAGSYTDRRGKRYEYTHSDRLEDLTLCEMAAKRYASKIYQGYSEEHARDMLPFGIRQNWVMSFNMRSLMHFLTIRGKRDAQLEIQQLCQLMLPHFEAWAPDVYGWFRENLWLKGRLAP